MTHTAVETDMAFAILAVAHGYEVVAITFGKAFNAVFCPGEGFSQRPYCTLLVGSVLYAGSVPSIARRLKSSWLFLNCAYR
nr:hypothetical protein [uncultured Pseudomonas sp.]